MRRNLEAIIGITLVIVLTAMCAAVLRETFEARQVIYKVIK